MREEAVLTWQIIYSAASAEVADSIPHTHTQIQTHTQSDKTSSATHAEWKKIWEDFPSVNTYNDIQKWWVIRCVDCCGLKKQTQLYLKQHQHAAELVHGNVIKHFHL